MSMCLDWKCKCHRVASRLLVKVIASGQRPMTWAHWAPPQTRPREVGAAGSFPAPIEQVGPLQTESRRQSRDGQ